MKRLFISYTRDDKNTCKDLARWLQQAGYDVWYDDNLKGGETWWRRICDEIKACDVTILLMQPKVFDSIYCPVEVQYARTLGKAVLPLKLVDFDDAELPSWLAHVSYEPWTGEPTIADFAKVLGAVNNAASGGAIEGVQMPPQPQSKNEQLAQRASAIRKAIKDAHNAGQQHELIDDIVAFDADGASDLAPTLLAELNSPFKNSCRRESVLV